jgi:serine protease Do
MIRPTSVLIILFLLSFHFSFGQKLQGKKLEEVIESAIQRSFSACVKIWAFDTTAKEQMSAPFSGVVVTKDGHILTAAHVISPGNTYQVTFPDGKKCVAIALGKITKTQIIPDVGMMKIITAGYWPYASMGHSYSLRINEPCISISYPESLYQDFPIIRFGYITNIKNERGFIQSTCVMEPGDSGGPLFDYNGNVIGLHSAIEISEKMNFDVPVDLCRKYWKSLNIPRIYHSFPKVSEDNVLDSVEENIAVINTNNLYGNRFKKIVSKYSKTCVRIISGVNGNHQEALGTLFNIKLKNGKQQAFIVSKSSIVCNDSIWIFTPKEKIYASVVTRDKANDMVLLKPVAYIKGGLRFSQLLRNAETGTRAGRFIVSLLPNSLGIFSTTGSGSIKVKKIFSMGSFGTSILYKDSTLMLNKIQPGSPADIGGMRTGDVLISINDKSISDPSDFFNALNQFWPGDTIIIKLRRSGTILEKPVTLKPVHIPPSEHPAEHFEGGPSKIRDGFDKVFTHDAILHPEMCGGPIYDVNGFFCGINVARHSRASTLAMPASVVFHFIEKVLQDN